MGEKKHTNPFFGAEAVIANRRTDRHDETNTNFISNARKLMLSREGGT
jgi:hypothetical protein